MELQNGIGTLLSQEYDKIVTKWKAVSQRIIYNIDLILAEILTLIQVYAPTEGIDVLKIVEFFEKLQTQLVKARKRSTHVMRDLNSRIEYDTNIRLGCTGKGGGEEILNSNGNG